MPNDDGQLLQAAQDYTGKTALDVAPEYGALLSERVLKKHYRQRRREHLHADIFPDFSDSSRQYGSVTAMTTTRAKSATWNPYKMANEHLNSDDITTTSPTSALLSVRSMHNASLPSSRSVRHSNSRPHTSSQQYRIASTHSKRKAEEELSKRGQGHGHDKCSRLPPFIGVQCVEPNAMRMETVEVVVLDTMNFEQRLAYNGSAHATLVASTTQQSSDCPKPPHSSPSASTENMTTVGLLTKDNTLPGANSNASLHSSTTSRCKSANATTALTRPSYRAQSAKYYKTQYHLLAEEDKTLPKPR